MTLVATSGSTPSDDPTTSLIPLPSLPDQEGAQLVAVGVYSTGDGDDADWQLNLPGGGAAFSSPQSTSNSGNNYSEVFVPDEPAAIQPGLTTTAEFQITNESNNSGTLEYSLLIEFESEREVVLTGNGVSSSTTGPHFLTSPISTFPQRSAELVSIVGIEGGDLGAEWNVENGDAGDLFESEQSLSQLGTPEAFLPDQNQYVGSPFEGAAVDVSTTSNGVLALLAKYEMQPKVGSDIVAVQLQQVQSDSGGNSMFTQAISAYPEKTAEVKAVSVHSDGNANDAEWNMEIQTAPGGAGGDVFSQNKTTIGTPATGAALYVPDGVTQMGDPRDVLDWSVRNPSGNPGTFHATAFLEIQ
jgi:hypothetical protein